MIRIRKNRSTARAYKRKFAVRLFCTAVLSSNILTGNIFPCGNGVVVVYAAEKLESGIPEDAIVVNIGEVQIENQMITYRVSENGKYCFTGSNLINDVRVPAQIIVEEGVNAEIYFNGLDIENVDGYYLTSGAGIKEATIPFVVNGTAQVYVVDDSQLMHNGFVGSIDISASGKLIINGENSKELMMGMSDYKWTGNGINNSGILVLESGSINMQGYYYGINNSGKTYINGGCLKIIESYYPCNNQNGIYVSGGNLYGDCYSVSTSGIQEVTGGNIKGFFGDVSNDGHSVKKDITIQGAVSEKIVGINYTDGESKLQSYGCRDMSFDENGNLVLYVAEDAVAIDIYTEKDNEICEYRVDSENNVTTFTPKRVTYVDDDDISTVLTYGYANQEGNTVIPNELPYYEYTVTDGNFTGTGITQDIVVTAKKNKKKYSITYSGVYAGTSETYYGEDVELPLPEHGVYKFSKGSTLFFGNYITSDESVTVSQVYKVAFNYKDGTTETRLTDENGTVMLPENTKDISYTFYVDGTPFDGTNVTGDIEVTVEEVRREYTITYKGEKGEVQSNRTAYYGDPIKPEGAEDGWIYVLEDGSSVDTVQGDATIYVLKGIVENDKSYCTISTAEDLKSFSDLVNSGLVKLNAVLTRDIDTAQLEADWTPIGTPVNIYSGTFDGQGHTITLNLVNTAENESADNYAAISNVTDGAVIRNLIVEGSVSGHYAVAGIVGSAWDGEITIENCINRAKITATSTDVAGIIGTNRNSDASITIKNCGNEGNVSGSNYSAAICGWIGDYAKVINCYNIGTIEGFSDSQNSFCRGGYFAEMTNCYCQENLFDCQATDNLSLVTAEQFVSGEITYKLNGSQSENVIWYQKLGDGGDVIPTLFPTNKENSVVYYGYPDCEATELEYCNRKKETTGHEWNAGEVTTKPTETKTGVRTYTCEICEQTKTEDISILTAHTWSKDWTKDDTYHWHECTNEDCTVTENSGKDGYESHVYDNEQDATCNICGYTKAALHGRSITLGGDIGVNFYMELSEEVATSENTYMLFEVDGKERKVFAKDLISVTMEDGKKCYQFRCDVGASQMTDQITAKFYAYDQLLGEYTYSVKEYANTIIADEDKYDSDTVECVKAMLNYGAAAQLHFNYHTDKLANEDLADKQIASLDGVDFSAYEKVVDSSVEGIEYKSSSTILNSKTTIRHYFTLKEDADIEDYTFKVDGTMLIPHKKNDRYYVDIPNIAAFNYDHMYEFTIEKDQSKMSIKFGVCTYINLVSKSETMSDDVKEVVKAAYWYYRKTDSYIKKQ